MSYVYTAVVQYQNSSGRFVNLTGAATVTAYDLSGNAISGATITNIATGVYKVSVTQADLEDVVFRVVPAVADQADFDDVAVMQEKVYHVADDAYTAIQALPDNVWGYTTRTLTQAATSIAAAVSGSSITDIRGNSWSIDVADLTLDSNLIQLIIKRKLSDADSASLLMVDTTTGLLYVNGADASDATKASLSYTGTTLTITVDASITAALPVGSWKYGIQSITAAGAVAENYRGTFIISEDAVHTTT